MSVVYEVDDLLPGAPEGPGPSSREVEEVSSQRQAKREVSKKSKKKKKKHKKKAKQASQSARAEQVSESKRTDQSERPPINEVEARLRKAGEFIDEDGNVDFRGYLDEMEAEKKRRRKERYKEVLYVIRTAVIVVAIGYCLVSGLLIICLAIGTAGDHHVLKRQNYEVSNFDMHDKYKIGNYLGTKGKAVDFEALIRDCGGSDVQYQLGEESNAIEFDLNGERVVFWSMVGRDKVTSYIYVSAHLQTIEVRESMDDGRKLVYAGNACFRTSSLGEEMLRCFLDTDASSMTDRANETSAYMERRMKAIDGGAETDDSQE